jgi:membrane protease YdiL (CAAX protease family)
MSSFSACQQSYLPAEVRHRIGSYWCESKRPLTSLLFVLPMLMAYELGVLTVPTTMRNGADALMRRLLDALGFGGYFLLPCLTVALLLAWHHALREPWRVRMSALVWMLAESVGLAIALITVAHLQGILFPVALPDGRLGSPIGSPQVTSPEASVATATYDSSKSRLKFDAVSPPGGAAATGSVKDRAIIALGRILAYCGAGVYEETLFRLLLLPVAASAAALAGLSRRWQTAVAVVSTSLLFSLAHYVGAGGDAWSISSFIFRFLAGTFFALLLVARGFGIIAGMHAIFDVMVGVDG